MNTTNFKELTSCISICTNCTFDCNYKKMVNYLDKEEFCDSNDFKNTLLVHTNRRLEVIKSLKKLIPRLSKDAIISDFDLTCKTEKGLTYGKSRVFIDDRKKRYTVFLTYIPKGQVIKSRNINLLGINKFISENQFIDSLNKKYIFYNLEE
ncbi:MAG: hypothetical protein RSB67_04095 [Clostridia bacterium]